MPLHVATCFSEDYWLESEKGFRHFGSTCMSMFACSDANIKLTIGNMTSQTGETACVPCEHVWLTACQWYLLYGKPCVADDMALPAVGRRRSSHNSDARRLQRMDQAWTAAEGLKLQPSISR